MHIRDYIEHLKRKPVHVRKQIALGSSTALIAVVIVGWLTAFLSSDALALAPTDPGLDEDLAKATQETGNGFSELLGAASAFKTATEGGNGLVIVDGSASSTIQDAPAEDTRTVIPF